ncbi:hypothetical protein Cme02nite_72560 [Catellatospora methionotrophica]|uniref:Uncharacterized protein n=1 Tax=Catellatospora methionotrophica TaxID=121620 RepID=A0A8J3LNQ7_9ACTN|nr:hypothetical protein [Catellatospora methionotrophica]GIG18924.1 hypothetical protein Cme02nite_72560 [Catellatospora methionotrophica]
MSSPNVNRAESRPTWADENTQEWTIAERLRYELIRCNDARTWATPSAEDLRSIADFLGLESEDGA